VSEKSEGTLAQSAQQTQPAAAVTAEHTSSTAPLHHNCYTSLLYCSWTHDRDWAGHQRRSTKQSSV